MGRTRTIALAAALFIAVAALYSHTLFHGFVYDDHIQIEKNHWITSPAYLGEVFSSHSFGFSMPMEEGTTYRPMVFAVYMAEYAAFGLAPAGWHLVNVLLHGVNSVIVFLTLIVLARAHGRDEGAPLIAPFAGAALFALHPASGEVVAWVGCIPELFMALLGVLSITFYLRSRLPDCNRGAWAAASVVAFFAALFFKETALAIPAVIFVHEAATRGRAILSPRPVARYAAYLCAAIAYFAIRLHALGGLSPRENMYPFLNGYQYLLNGAALFVKYMRVLLAPVADHPLQLLDPVYSITEPRAAMSVAFIAALIAAVVTLRRKIGPGYLFALSIIVIPLLPALYIPGISRASFADRYLYLPSFGLAIAVFMLLRATRPGKGLWAVMVAAAVVYAALAVNNSLRWRDDLKLWSAAYAGSDENYLAMAQIGEAHLLREEYAAAVPWLEKGIEKAVSGAHPDTGVKGDASLNLAYALRKLGRPEEAAKVYLGILAEYPGHASTRFELATVYQEMSLYDDAIREYALALEGFGRPPEISDTLVNMGNCLAKKGDMAGAAARYREALEVLPSNATALKNLRVVAGAAGLR